MRIVLAGSGGFIGSRIRRVLPREGHRVLRLVRREARGDAESRWDPAAGLLDDDALTGTDAVINLAGAGVGDHRWTPGYQALIRSSRVDSTALLAEACARLGVPVLLNASAVGIYGNRGTEILTEASPAGGTFLAGVCTDWEAATAPATASGTRVVNLRSGLVLGADGGLLPRLARLTRFGLGGRLGSGEQYMPWISITDEVAAILHLLTAEVRGPVNLTAPSPVSNREFTSELGRALHRPAPWVVPGAALQVALGGFAAEVLGGQRAIPEVLSASGFSFTHRTLAAALRAELAASG